MKKQSSVKKMLGIMAATSMLASPGAGTTIEHPHKSIVQNQYAALPEVVYQYSRPFNFLRGVGRRGRRKNRHCSFMGPGVRKKRTNKIHRSRMLKRKHAKR